MKDADLTDAVNKPDKGELFGLVVLLYMPDKVERFNLAILLYKPDKVELFDLVVLSASLTK